LDGKTTFECTAEGPLEGIAKLRAEEKAIQFIQSKEKSAGRLQLENGAMKCKLLTTNTSTGSLQLMKCVTHADRSFTELKRNYSVVFLGLNIV